MKQQMERWKIQLSSPLLSLLICSVFPSPLLSSFSLSSPSLSSPPFPCPALLSSPLPFYPNLLSIPFSLLCFALQIDENIFYKNFIAYILPFDFKISMMLNEIARCEYFVSVGVVYTNT